MRRLNTKYKVDFISEKGFDNTDKTYFAYIPFENLMCLAVAESCDNYSTENSAEIAVKAVLEAFERKPSLKKLKQYINEAHAVLCEKRLEASIIVVVSDYTRFRYASCGNVKLYLLNNDAVELESKPHSFIYEKSDQAEYAFDKELIHEPRNLSMYLGQNTHPKPFVSKKIDLIDGCTMFFATVNIWEALENVEILDAYTNAEDFLECIQELYIPTEREASVIGSYTIASLFFEKPFVEDELKKKKRRKIINMSIVVAVLLIIIFLIVNFFDKRSIARIRDLDHKGTEQFDYGNNAMVYDMYDEASTLTNSLGLRWLLRTNEKAVLRETIPRIKELFHNINRGDEEFEKGNYETAHSFYEMAKELCFILSKEADANIKYAPKMFDLLEQVSTYIEARIARNGKYVTVIRLIKEANIMIVKDSKFLEAMAVLREAEKLVSDIDNLDHRDRLSEQINDEIRRIVDWVDTKSLKASEREGIGDYDGAIIVYEEMMLNYIELGEISKASEMQDKIGDMKARKKAEEDAVTSELAEANLRNGDRYLALNNFENAIIQYTLARDLYTRLKMTEEIKAVNEKISDAQAKMSEAEIQGGVLAAQMLENEGDILLSNFDYVGAKIQYRQAQAAYQSLNQVDKVTAVQDKINAANEMEIADRAEQERLENERSNAIAENEKKRLVTSGGLLENEGDSFVNDGNFAQAIDKYHMARDFYWRAEDIDKALVVITKIYEAERRERERLEAQQNLQTEVNDAQ